MRGDARNGAGECGRGCNYCGGDHVACRCAGRMGPMAIIVARVAAVDGQVSPGADQFIITREGWIVGWIARIAHADVDAAAPGIGMIVAITANVRKRWVAGINPGIDHSDDNALTFRARQAAGCGAVPNPRSANPGGAGVRVEFHLLIALDENHARHLGDTGSFLRGQADGHAVIG